MPLNLSLVGKWEGTTFTAYASVWDGKFKSKSTSLSASWEIWDCGYSNVTSSSIGVWIDFSVSVGGQEWVDGTNFTLDFSDTYTSIYNAGWNACLNAVTSETKTYYQAGGTISYYTSNDGVTVSGGPYTRTV